MTIKTIQLNSTALLSAEYDDETQQLSVTFVNGGTYTLRQQVPPEVVDGLEQSSSPGQYWHTVLKAYT